TALKCIGLLQLMAQSAIPIPAGVDSRLPVFNQVLAEIGDEQSVSEGLSTFSAHIRRISWILEHCQGEALVLLDELGKATDPMQAGGLARAILEALLARGAITLVTTHLSTLKDWAHDHPNGRNASYRLDPDTHRPLYRLKMDTPGISEAFTIALAEGLPADIVQAAHEQIPKDERDLSEMLETLHDQEERLRESLAEVRAEKSKAEKARKRLELERAAAQKAKLRADKDLEEEYKRLLDKARADIEKRIANLPSRKAMSQAREELARDQKHAEKRLQAMEDRERKILEKEIPPEKKETVPPREPEEGDYVTIKDGHQSGLLESVDKNKGRATVSMGGLKVQTKLKDLKLAEAPEKPKTTSTTSRFTQATARSVAREINLTGERVEPAIDRLDRYIDSALLANMPSVRIIHGFGTGALRSAVHEWLNHHPQIKRFELAPREEGGGGATIAYL
ncbi:MAG: endonuclease MutS2, partial [Candidatus Sumerlaeota bacterium]